MQPILINKNKSAESHYIKNRNGTIDHRPARGNYEDKSLVRSERENFNFYHCLTLNATDWRITQQVIIFLFE